MVGSTWGAGVSHTGAFHVLTAESAALLGASAHQPSLSPLHAAATLGYCQKSLTKGVPDFPSGCRPAGVGQARLPAVS